MLLGIFHAFMGSVSRRFLLIPVALLLVAFIFGRGERDSSWSIRNAWVGSGPIVCFGDSLTYGHGAPRGRAYPDVLSDLLGREVVNLGRNGDTTARALERLDDVLALEPALVIITLGGNDMLRRLPPGATIENLRTIFARILEAGTPVVFLGIDPPLLSSDRMDLARAMARELGVLWIDRIMDDLWGDRAKMSDQIHPNEAGYRIMAERVAKALRARELIP